MTNATDPRLHELAQTYAAAVDDYRPAAAAARDAALQRHEKWSAVTDSYRQLRDHIAEHYGTNQDSPTRIEPYDGCVILDGTVIHAGDSPDTA